MSKLTKIVVEQAEGLTEDMKPFTFEGENCVEQAEAKLREIAVNGPEMGYYKTDVEVTLADGTVRNLCPLEIFQGCGKGCASTRFRHVST